MMGAKHNSAWPTYPYHIIKMGNDAYRATNLQTGEDGPLRETYWEAEQDAWDLRTRCWNRNDVV